MLKIEQLHTYYGALHILKGVTLQIDEGQLVCLIGANGAGKSTLLKAISGLIHPTSGNIVYNGVSLNRLSPPDIVRLGITHVPEGRLVFPGVTVRVNLEMGAFLRKDKQGIAESFERVYTLFPRLKERSRQQAQTLSGGEQQMLAIARGLMANPKMLLLDEPSLGLAPVLVDQVADTIKEINRTMKMPILLVEQNAVMALGMADYAYVIEVGEITKEGTGQALLKDEEVKTAFLGI